MPKLTLLSQTFEIRYSYHHHPSSKTLSLYCLWDIINLYLWITIYCTKTQVPVLGVHMDVVRHKVVPSVEKKNGRWSWAKVSLDHSWLLLLNFSLRTSSHITYPVRWEEVNICCCFTVFILVVQTQRNCGQLYLPARCSCFRLDSLYAHS